MRLKLRPNRPQARVWRTGTHAAGAPLLELFHPPPEKKSFDPLALGKRPAHPDQQGQLTLRSLTQSDAAGSRQPGRPGIYYFPISRWRLRAGLPRLPIAAHSSALAAKLGRA